MIIPVTTDSGTTHLFTMETYARWLCLIEALQIITNNAKKNNTDLEKNESWIQPIALQRYIKDRYPAMLAALKFEEDCLD